MARMKNVWHKIIVFSILTLLLIGIFFFTGSGDIAFAVGGDTSCSDTFYFRSPQSCTSLCVSNGYAYGSSTTCDAEPACHCSGVASTGTGGGAGSGGSGASSSSGSGTGGSASISGGETCSGAFLTAPAAECGTACRGKGFSQTKYIADPSGVMKCCCYGTKLPKEKTKGTGTFGPDEANPFGEVYDVPMLVGKALRLFMGILGVIALVIFIYGGFLWMISLGDETRVKKGRETMIWAGMGLIAIVGSYVVIQFILETVLKPPQPITSAASPPGAVGSISSSSAGGGAGGGTGSGASTGTGGVSSGGSGGSGSTGGSSGSASGSSGSAGSGATGTSGTGSGASTGTSGGGSGSSGGSQQPGSTALPDFYVTPPAQPTISVYAANNIDALTVRYETTLDKTTGMVTTSGGYHQPLGAMSFGKDGAVPYVEEFHIYESGENKLVFFSKNSDGTEMATKVGDDGSFSIEALSYTAAEPSQMVKWNIDGGAAHAFNSQGFKFASGGSVKINGFLASGQFNTPDGGSISLDRPEGVVINSVDIKTGEDRGGSIAGGYDYP